MEDKLLKILKIKIDAINRNIDNLNYLNGELERNNKDLEYIDGKLSLFKDGSVLNFDNIKRDDFEKILLMVNSNISEIFKDKTCNYDGIIYIIEGIRKSISLQLTADQTKAITTFILGMQEKRENLLETISNLTESKNRLPETDLNILTNNLDGYNNIVSKFENNLYLTEIDEIGDALNFADVLTEEKADIYEFILKYNANIYSLKENDKFSDTDNIIKQDDFNMDIPDFNYDTVNVTNDLLDEKEASEENNEEKSDLEKDDTAIDDIKFNLDNFKFDEDKTVEIPVQSETEMPDVNEQTTEINFNNDYDLPSFDDNLNLDVENNIATSDENHELNTVELEDIIKKIDAKLKEMEKGEEVDDSVNDDNSASVEETSASDLNFNNEESTEKTESVELPESKFSEESNIQTSTSSYSDTDVSFENNQEPQITLTDLDNKYHINDMNIETNNLNDVDKMLQILVDNNLLDILKENKNVLELMLNNYKNDALNELITLIKENLIVKTEEFDDTFNIIVETLPILFTDLSVFDSFKKNIKFYKEKNINIINIYDNYRELLIINNDLLVNNYNKVISYGLEINSDNVKYLLYNKDVINNIDYYIEAIGYEKGFLGKEEIFDGVSYIKKHPYKLNNASRDMLLKLRYTSENNGKIYGNKPGILAGEITNSKVDIINLTPEYISSFFNGEYNAIDKNTLNTELDNLSNYDMTLDGNLNKLDQNYKKDELRYQFNRIVISRIKTIRIYNYLKSKLDIKDALIVALTYNSVLKKDEYESIVNIVNNIIGGM